MDAKLRILGYIHVLHKHKIPKVFRFFIFSCFFKEHILLWQVFTVPELKTSFASSYSHRVVRTADQHRAPQKVGERSIFHLRPSRRLLSGFPRDSYHGPVCRWRDGKRGHIDGNIHGAEVLLHNFSQVNRRTHTLNVFPLMGNSHFSPITFVNTQSSMENYYRNKAKTFYKGFQDVHNVFSIT